MRIYPQSTANPNVPKNVFLVAEIQTMSGEIVTTYYIDKKGNMFKVSDWVNDKPSSVFPFRLWRLTGDTPAMLEFRWRQYFDL